MNALKSAYSIYALLIAGTVAYSQWRGWSLDRVDEVNNVPRSIRDNPGAYRQHYAGARAGWWGFGGGRYTGGK
jgi:hypothetical protein